MCESKEFIWEVVPGSAGREQGSETGKEANGKHECVGYLCGQSGLSPAGDHRKTM